MQNDLATQSIFENLSSPIRFEILTSLSNEPMKPSQIAKNQKMTIQGIQRHIKRLIDTKLVEKYVDGKIALTPIGEITLQQMPTFEFLTKNSSYFSSHTLTGVPSFLIQRIGELNNSELISDVMRGWQVAKEIAENAKKFLYSVTITMPNEAFDVLQTALQDNLQTKILFGRNTYVSKGYYIHPARKSWVEAKKRGQVEERYVKHVPLTVLISENDAHVQFANKNLGEPDTLGLFVSKDELFKQWCLDLFHYYWNDVSKVDEFKLQER